MDLSAAEMEGESEEKRGRGGVDGETCLGARGPGAGEGGPPLAPGMLPLAKVCLSGNVLARTLFRWRPIVLELTLIL